MAGRVVLFRVIGGIGRYGSGALLVLKRVDDRLFRAKHRSLAPNSCRPLGRARAVTHSHPSRITRLGLANASRMHGRFPSGGLHKRKVLYVQ